MIPILCCRIVEGCSRIRLEECNVIGNKCLGLESIDIYIRRQDPIQLAIQVPENNDTHWERLAVDTVRHLPSKPATESKPRLIDRKCGFQG
jgi:hypothetical protein